MIDTLKKIREALTDCVETLAAEIEAQYAGPMLDYPVNQKRYERDMETVEAGRDAIALLDGMIEGGGWEAEPKYKIPFLAHLGGKCVPSQCLICYGAQMGRDKHDLLGAVSKAAPPAQTEISSGEDK